jgi:hypothetical protein
MITDDDDDGVVVIVVVVMMMIVNVFVSDAIIRPITLTT